jgi:hypothetical protein
MGWHAASWTNALVADMKSDGRLMDLPAGYALVLAELKDQIKSARIKAGLAVNRELVLLYRGIGRQI